MKLRFSDARIWRYSLAAVAELVESAAFEIDENGFRVRAIDPSHVSMIDFYVPREAFDVFDVENKATYNVNLETVSKFLKRASKKDELQLEFEGGKISTVLISPDGVERRFKTPLLYEKVSEEVPEIQVDFPVRAKLYSQAFYTLYKVLSEAGDTLTLVYEDNELRFIGSSDIGEVEVSLSAEQGTLIALESADEGSHRSSYSIEYFDDTAKVSRLADDVDLEFGTDLPCKVVLNMLRGTRLTLYVAPRAE